jgi:hypothetical protein
MLSMIRAVTNTLRSFDFIALEQAASLGATWWQPMAYPATLYDTYNLDSFQVSSAATTVFMLMLFPALVVPQYVAGSELEEAGQGA